MDRIAWAQSRVESMRVSSAGTKGDETEMWEMLMREAVELRARGWPEDYPAGAMEWLLVELTTPRRLVCTVCWPASMLK
ncbi:hypothetical protein SBC2_09140 [Caballeronia sp. SBC2]|nr:hypothetical protein SBC2_09140 [Caballeronia sp. SBC2]